MNYFDVYEALEMMAKEIRRTTPLFKTYETLAKVVGRDTTPMVNDEDLMQRLGFTAKDILSLASTFAYEGSTSWLKDQIYGKDDMWSDRVSAIIESVMTEAGYVRSGISQGDGEWTPPSLSGQNSDDATAKNPVRNKKPVRKIKKPVPNRPVYKDIDADEDANTDT